MQVVWLISTPILNFESANLIDNGSYDSALIHLRSNCRT